MLEVKTFAVELKVSPEGASPTLEGYASAFHCLDAYNDIVGASAFSLPSQLQKILPLVK